MTISERSVARPTTGTGAAPVATAATAATAATVAPVAPAATPAVTATAITLIVAVLLAGCGRAGNGSDGPKGAAPQKVLMLTEDLPIGAPGQDDVFFSSAWEAAEDEDGRIYVEESAEALVRVFDSEGEFLFDLVGQGQAPGQLQNLQTFVVAGDSIAAFDYRPVYVVFDRETGAFRRRGEIPVPDGYAQHAIIQGLSSAGLVVALTEPQRDMLDRHDTRDMLLIEGGSSGSLLWTGPTQELLAHEIGNGGVAFATKPQGTNSFCAVSSARLYCAANDSLEIDVVELRDNNPAMWRLSIPFDPLEATASDKAKWAGEIRGDEMKALFHAPDHWKALRDLKVDDTGKLWLNVYSTRSDSVVTWWVVDPDTQYRAAVHLDASEELLHVRANKVYVRSSNEAGEAWVTRHRFQY